MKYTVYIIQNPESRLYIGVSEDPHKRLEDHNAGISKWTKGKGPWSLIWTRACASLGEARKLENLLKRQKGGAGLWKITGLNPSGS